MSTTQESAIAELLTDARSRLDTLAAAALPGPRKTRLTSAAASAATALKTALLALRDQADDDQAAIP